MHESVLLDEIAEWLGPGPGAVIVDGTVGLGGHADRMLQMSGPQGRLVGFDKDPEALVRAGERLAKYGERVMLIRDNFKNIPVHLEKLKTKNIHGLLLDLGVSSPQLDDPKRGFSFRFDGPLDMRMDPAQALTAAAIVNGFTEERLAEIFWTFGEERFSRRIARRIVEHRNGRVLETTQQLENIIFNAVPQRYRHGRLHPATRVFQALRIVVNREMDSLKEFLEGPILDYLSPGGRLAIIAFHSLEDRLVKNAFKRYVLENKGSVLTRKPLTPKETEVGRNPRARSAKLRILEKMGGLRT